MNESSHFSVQTSQHAKKTSWQLRAFLLGLCGVLTVLILLTYSIFRGNEKYLDVQAFHFLEAHTSPWLTQLFIRLTFFGSTTFLLPAYIIVVVYFLFFKRNRVRSLNIIIVSLGSAVLLICIKRFFRRERPLHPLITNFEGFSYPSGHSFSAFTFAGILIYVLWETGIHVAWKWISSVMLFLFAASIAISRVYLHVHYASDVLAGLCFSILWLALSIFVLQKLTRKAF